MSPKTGWKQEKLLLIEAQSLMAKRVDKDRKYLSRGTVTIFFSKEFKKSAYPASLIT